MRSKLICVDMDGTLCDTEEWTIEGCRLAQPRQPIIDATNRAYMENFVVIYTARRDELMPITLEWLRRNNVRYHAISNQKIPTDIYVDDKMISLKEFEEDGY